MNDPAGRYVGRDLGSTLAAIDSALGLSRGDWLAWRRGPSVWPPSNISVPTRPISAYNDHMSATFRLDPLSADLKKNGVVVGITDQPYEIAGDTVVFDEVLVKGDLADELEYNGLRLKVDSVEEIIGLMIGPTGARGPVWRGVSCVVVK